MAWTQLQIDALKVAIVSGTKTVKYQDREVTYQNLDQMLQLLALMEAEGTEEEIESGSRTSLVAFHRD